MTPIRPEIDSGDETLARLEPVQPSLPVGPLSKPPTPFIGRERELTELASLLREDSARLVTLTGPGEAGKTRLALQVAEILAPAFNRAVHFVGLASVVDPGLALPAIAQQIGLRASGEPAYLRLKTYFAARHSLLVLDGRGAGGYGDIVRLSPCPPVPLRPRRAGLAGREESRSVRSLRAGRTALLHVGDGARVCP